MGIYSSCKEKQILWRMQDFKGERLGKHIVNI